MTFEFECDEFYEPCINSTTYIVKRPVYLVPYKPVNTNLGKTIKISGKAYIFGEPVKDLTINITVGDEKFSAVSDYNGYYTINYTTKEYGVTQVQHEFFANKYYEGYSINTSFIVKYPTELYVYSIPAANYGDSIVLKGVLYARLPEGILSVSNQPINITINGKHYTSMTDWQGFTLNYTVDTYNKTRITFRYPGSSRHESCTNSTTLTVKVPTNLFMYQRRGDVKGSTIKVSGKLQTNGEGIKNQEVTIKVNDVTYHAKTGGYGYFTVNHTIMDYDDLNVTFMYSGMYPYQSSNNSTVYTVLKPVNPTTLFMYSRSHDAVGSTIKVSGKLLSDSAPVKGGVISISVNDMNYSAVSDHNGYFTVNHTIMDYDDLNVTFYYEGNATYYGCSNSTVYTVLKPVNPTSLFIYDRNNDVVGSTIKVSGKLLSNGVGIKGEVVNIMVNNMSYTAISGGYGYFTINHTITTDDDLNVTFTYDGTSIYLPTSNSTIYTVIITRTPTNLFMYNRNEDSVGTTIKVSGKLLSDGTPVKGGVISISVNYMNYTAVSDRNGYFTVNHTIISYDDLNVTFSYDGNGTYNPCNNSTVYTVLKYRNHTNLFMYTRSGDTYGSTIKVSGKLQSYDEGVKGETIVITVNGERFTAVSGGYGYFTINYTITSYEDLHVIFNYAGSGKYMSSSNSTVYTVKNASSVKKDTYFALYPRGAINGNTIKFSGKLLSNGTGVTGQSITINVNGVIFNPKTDSYGYFAIYYTSEIYDNHTIVCTYTGNDEFAPCTNTTTFALKQSAIMKIYSMTDYWLYDAVHEFRGRLMANWEYNVGIGNQTVNIMVNDEVLTVVTDNDGFFYLNYTYRSLDPILIIYKFDGNVFYESAECNFTVEHVYRRTNVIIYPIELPTTGNTIEIKLRLMSMGTPVNLQRGLCSIRVNGRILNFTLTPDSQGYIIANYTMENYGKYTIDVEFLSFYPYSGSRNSTTFTWVKT